MNDFRRQLEALINRYSQENGSNTPDFILAEYLTNCLNAFNVATFARERWYGHRHRPGGICEPVPEPEPTTTDG